MPTTLIHAPITSPSAALRVMSRMVEGLSDPTMLLNRDLDVIFANAEARMRFVNSNLTLHVPFTSFIQSVFPEAEATGLARTFRAVIAAPAEEASTFFLRDSDREIQLRITNVQMETPEERDEKTSPALSITFFLRDAETQLPRLEFVLNSSTDGIFIVNRANKIIFFNSACEKMTGWQRGAAIETYECANVLQCHNEAGESMGSEALCPAKVFFRRDLQPTSHEMLITAQSGKERWVETTYSPIKNAAGEVEFIVGIIRDIDERKRLESQLVQNRNLASLGVLMSGIAHEIKNPLGIIMSSVEVLTNEKRPLAQRHEAASFLKDEVRRLDERVTDFLAFARPKPLMAEPVNINALLKKVILSYSSLNNRRFKITADLCSVAPMTTADPDLLHQVFLNLVINADQAMPGGGELIVKTETRDDQIRVQFCDAGCGIAEENLPKIFDPFFTTKKNGTGLGLSIVHQILTSHRGRINVFNNAESPGVTFEMSLPAQPAHVA